jgi:hypothetical protein
VRSQVETPFGSSIKCAVNICSLAPAGRHLCSTLSCEAAPRVDMLVTILTALGCRLSIEPLKNEDFRSARVGVDTRVAPSEGIKPDMAFATDNK